MPGSYQMLRHKSLHWALDAQIVRRLRCDGSHCPAAMARSAPPTEEQLWSYLVQLISALRAAHGSGLLLRPASLLPSKVLLTGPGRIRVGEPSLPSECHLDL